MDRTWESDYTSHRFIEDNFITELKLVLYNPSIQQVISKMMRHKMPCTLKSTISHHQHINEDWYRTFEKKDI